MNRIDVYYDGVNIDKFYDNPNVKGFTTNISFLKAAGISDYHSFITDSLKYIQGRPISFQLYDDLDEDIETTAKKISSYDKEHIFVKIPVIKTTTESNANIIKKLHNETIKINVTAIFTKEQIDSISSCFDKNTDVIVSIFAGRINDSGLDCSDVVKHAVETFKEYPNIKILWAACRTVYNMFEAENQGAHIVTVPDTVLSRMNRIGDDTYDASVQQVKQFMKDGIDGNIIINTFVPPAFIINLNIPNLHLHPLKYVFEQLKIEKQENELWLEFGVFHGNSINYISQFTTDIVYGFDSFEGLPEDWRENHLKGEFKVNNLPKVNYNVKLIKGWFNDTVEEFININKDKQISFLHLDADLYSSTKYVLDTLKNNIKNGCIIIFDELVNYKGFDGEKGELRAFYEFIQENNVNYEYIGMDGIVNLKGSEYHIPNKTSVAIKIINIIQK
jgi:transaldolase